jgi:hypothetical protein
MHDVHGARYCEYFSHKMVEAHTEYTKYTLWNTFHKNMKYLVQI